MKNWPSKLRWGPSPHARYRCSSRFRVSSPSARLGEDLPAQVAEDDEEALEETQSREGVEGTEGIVIRDRQR
jgi:hypothetical protein